MSGFCPDDFHGTTEADLQQMEMGEDFWLLGGEELCFPRFAVRESSAYIADRKAEYAIHDRAIALAKQAGKEFQHLPLDQQNLLMDIANQAGETT